MIAIRVRSLCIEIQPFVLIDATRPQTFLMVTAIDPA
jgi:hypothetical protein